MNTYFTTARFNNYSMCHSPTFIRRFKSNCYSLLLSCAPGLEDILYHEVKLLQLQSLTKQKLVKGGVEIKVSDIRDIKNCHLHIGTASHVYLRCNSKPFKARKFEELYKIVSTMNCWEEFFSKSEVSRISVRAVAKKSKLIHTTAISQRIHDGVYSALGLENPNNNKTSKVENETKVVASVYKDEFQLFLDTSCTPFHKRGYRLETAKAPIREDLAYAMLLSAKWEGKQRNILLDPFCGSGTIPIEAASMALGLPPGRFRAPPLNGTKLYNEILWQSLVQKSLEIKSTNTNTSQIYANDRDKGAIQAARNNAKRAGVEHCITFSVNPFVQAMYDLKLKNENEKILVVTNPPYGVRTKQSRIKESDNPLLHLYQKFGHSTKLLGNPKVVFVTNDREIARRTGIEGLRTSFSTLNGGIPISIFSNLP